MSLVEYFKRPFKIFATLSQKLLIPRAIRSQYLRFGKERLLLFNPHQHLSNG